MRTKDSLIILFVCCLCSWACGTSGSGKAEQPRKNKLADPQSGYEKLLQLTPDQARIQLQEMGVDYTENNFIKSAAMADSELYDYGKQFYLFMASGMDPNVRSSINDQTALIAASGDANVPVVKVLLKRGADVNAKDSFGYTALIQAASHAFGTEKAAATMNALIAAGAELNVQTEATKGETALIKAASLGYTSIVKILLDAGADVNVKTDDGLSVLMYASGRDNCIGSCKGKCRPEIVKLILTKNPDINAVSDYGYTALLAASEQGNAEVVSWLLDKGADPNVENKDGDTPLINAAQSGSLAIVKAVFAKGANINAMNFRGTTALMAAIDRTDILKFLLENGGNPNISDKHGETALMSAAWFGKVDAVKLLLEHGADANLKGKYNSPLKAAKRNSNTRIVNMLQEAGARE